MADLTTEESLDQAYDKTAEKHEEVKRHLAAANISVEDREVLEHELAELESTLRTLARADRLNR